MAADVRIGSTEAVYNLAMAAQAPAAWRVVSGLAALKQHSAAWPIGGRTGNGNTSYSSMTGVV